MPAGVGYGNENLLRRLANQRFPTTAMSTGAGQTNQMPEPQASPQLQAPGDAMTSPVARLLEQGQVGFEPPVGVGAGILSKVPKWKLGRPGAAAQKTSDPLGSYLKSDRSTFVPQYMKEPMAVISQIDDYLNKLNLGQSPQAYASMLKRSGLSHQQLRDIKTFLSPQGLYKQGGTAGSLPEGTNKLVEMADEADFVELQQAIDLVLGGMLK